MNATSILAIIYWLRSKIAIRLIYQSVQIPMYLGTFCRGKCPGLDEGGGGGVGTPSSPPYREGAAAKINIVYKQEANKLLQLMSF